MALDPNPNLYVGNSLFFANTIVTDTHPTTVNSIAYYFGYNSAPTATLAFSNTVLDSGQTTNALLTVSGGTGAFTANLINTTLGGNVRQGPSNIIIFAPGGSNVISFMVSSPTSSNSFTMNYLVTDYGTTSNYVFNAVAQSFTVNALPALMVSSTASNGTMTNIITYGSNPVAVNAVASGGTPPFAFKWTLNGANAKNRTIAPASSYNTLALPAAGTYAYSVTVIDSALPNSIALASNTITIIKNTTLSRSTISPTSPTPTLSVGYYTIATLTFKGIKTINNQSQWSLYVNGALYGVTNSLISWSEQAQQGTYNFVFANPGNNNYTNYSIGTVLSVQGLTTAGSPGPTPILPSLSPAPQVEFTSLPVYASLYAGLSYGLKLGIKDTSTSPENITLSVGKGFANLMAFSTNEILSSARPGA